MAYVLNYAVHVCNTMSLLYRITCCLLYTPKYPSNQIQLLYDGFVVLLNFSVTASSRGPLGFEVRFCMTILC